MQPRIAKRTTLQRLVISSCALAVLSSVGCKTGMSVPGASMLGFKKQPSAETLAGQGPTTTFPVSPSNNFTPNAIASKTAGTGSASSTVPQGAATANGFAAAGNPAISTGVGNPYAQSTTPPSYAAGGWGNTASTTPSTSTPGYAPTNSGYQTPTQASIPNYAAATDYAGRGTATPASAYTQPSSYTPPADSYSQPGGSTFAASPYGPAATNANPYASPTNAPAYTANGMSGYEAPGARVAGGFAMPQSSASSTGGNNGQSGAGVSSGTTAPAAYRPGSTAGATSYPTTPYSTPNGSMYR